LPEFVHEWEHEGRTFVFSWLGDVDVRPDRVYALAFTPDNQMLLVSNSDWEPLGWLPGGGIEEGETPEEALARELIEEANARVYRSAKLGIQLADDSSGRRSYQAYYWCRVTVDSEFHPEHEVSLRYLVPPEEFLDRLFWGRTDPKAAVLMARALEINNNNL
jgi:ADP-ribose pyrophosphatase YjhB (NUDIX family)